MMTCRTESRGVVNAAVKLDRALASAESGHGCCDPVSGHSAPAIVRYLIRTDAGRLAVTRRDALWLADVNYS